MQLYEARIVNKKLRIKKINNVKLKGNLLISDDMATGYVHKNDLNYVIPRAEVIYGEDKDMIIGNLKSYYAKCLELTEDKLKHLRDCIESPVCIMDYQEAK